MVSSYFLCSTVFFEQDGATWHFPLPVCTWLYKYFCCSLDWAWGNENNGPPAKLRSYYMWYFCLLLGQKNNSFNHNKRTLDDLNKNFEIILPPFLSAFLTKSVECVSSRLQQGVQNSGAIFWVQTLNNSFISRTLCLNCDVPWEMTCFVTW